MPGGAAACSILLYFSWFRAKTPTFQLFNEILVELCRSNDKNVLENFMSCVNFDIQSAFFTSFWYIPTFQCSENGKIVQLGGIYKPCGPASERRGFLLPVLQSKMGHKGWSKISKKLSTLFVYALLVEVCAQLSRSINDFLKKFLH